MEHFLHLTLLWGLLFCVSHSSGSVDPGSEIFGGNIVLDRTVLLGPEDPNEKFLFGEGGIDGDGFHEDGYYYDRLTKSSDEGQTDIGPDGVYRNGNIEVNRITGQRAPKKFDSGPDDGQPDEGGSYDWRSYDGQPDEGGSYDWRSYDGQPDEGGSYDWRSYDGQSDDESAVWGQNDGQSDEESAVWGQDDGRSSSSAAAATASSSGGGQDEGSSSSSAATASSSGGGQGQYGQGPYDGPGGPYGGGQNYNSCSHTGSDSTYDSGISRTDFLNLLRLLGINDIDGNSLVEVVMRNEGIFQELQARQYPVVYIAQRVRGLNIRSLLLIVTPFGQIDLRRLIISIFTMLLYKFFENEGFANIFLYLSYRYFLLSVGCPPNLLDNLLRLLCRLSQ